MGNMAVVVGGMGFRDEKFEVEVGRVGLGWLAWLVEPRVGAKRVMGCHSWGYLEVLFR